jgi:predicted secreted hydrolase
LDGRRFGFQFTLFRNALNPEKPLKNSNWRTNQIYMGHFALTDVEENRFFFSERFSRENADLAGVQITPFRIWLEDWEVKGDASNSKFPQQIRAKTKDIELDIQLTSLKPMVLQGNQGHSQKGSRPGNASYYYSFTRMKTQGTLKILNHEFKVFGNSWMDREWSTSALEKDQKGWDWFALQLSDGREIMLYQIRQKNGKADITSKGVVVDRFGDSRKLEWNELKLNILSIWTSPETGIKYPSGWSLEIPSENLNLQIMPLIKKQELRTAVNYWEGAVGVESIESRKELKGNGYVELTGYSG